MDTLAGSVATEYVSSATALWPRGLSICWCKGKVGNTTGSQVDWWSQCFPSTRTVKAPCNAREPSPFLRWAATGRRCCSRSAAVAIQRHDWCGDGYKQTKLLGTVMKLWKTVSASLVCLFLICTHPAATKKIRRRFLHSDTLGRGWPPFCWTLCEGANPPWQWLTAGRGGGQGCLHVRKGQEWLVSLFNISAAQGQRLLYAQQKYCGK